MKTLLFSVLALTLSTSALAVSSVKPDLSLTLTPQTSKLCDLKATGTPYQYMSEARWQGYTLRDIRYIEKHLVCPSGKTLGQS